MRTELEIRLRKILEEKNANLLPQNLKLGTSCFGVYGELEPVKNQNKKVTANGIYTPDSGYTGLGAVVVEIDTSVAQNTPLYTIEQDDEGNLWLVNNYDEITYTPYALDIDGNFIVSQDDNDTAVYSITENMELEVVING